MPAKSVISVVVIVLMSFVLSGLGYADQTLSANKVEVAPEIDGRDIDKAWNSAQAITTFDSIANLNIILKAVYTDSSIFFLISFPDLDESRTHRSWIWNKKTKMYSQGTDREDALVFKWAMSTKTSDLTLKANQPYKADVWFWKSCRTDPIGFIDDKYHLFSETEGRNSVELVSKSGKKMYLQRKGDAGKNAYKPNIYVEYQKNIMPRYQNRIPEGSRADIKAKGIWLDGKWTIELVRDLVTNNGDDVNFHDKGMTYKFGVSRYEISGRKAELGASEPLFGSGEISELLTLIFVK